MCTNLRGVRQLRVLSGNCVYMWVGGGGSVWLGYDWILLCAEGVAELRLGSRSPAQFFLGINKDLPLAPLLPLLWDWLGYVQTSIAFTLGLGPDYFQNVPWKSSGRLSSAR